MQVSTGLSFMIGLVTKTIYLTVERLSDKPEKN